MPVPGGLSIHLQHLFSAVRRVADQTLIRRIDDEIEQFQRNLTDEDRTVFGDLRDVDRAFPPLVGQTNCARDLECGKSRGRSSCPGSQGSETELVDERLGHREGRCARINQCFTNLDRDEPGRLREPLSQQA